MSTLARPFALLLLLAGTLRADLSVATLNCYLCFSPANHETISIGDIASEKLSLADYRTKIDDLAQLAATAKPDVVGLEEIGSEIEATDLAKAIEAAWPAGGAWRVCFVQGKDHETGEDVAALVRAKAVKLVGAARDDQALGQLSKHLVVTLDKKGAAFSVVVVHLVRPMNGQEPHHHRQLVELAGWINAHKATSATVILGDFNDTGRGLLPLHEAAELTHDAPTHMDRKEYDHVFAPTVKAARVTPPPYGPHPDKHTVALWTDHFMLSATVDR